MAGTWAGISTMAIKTMMETESTMAIMVTTMTSW
jgi:hypothetical protein